jgi:hypothetical protein
MKLAIAPMHRLPISCSRERGQIIILAALVVALVLGMGALAVDVGFFLHERQNVQKAVDAGALAGAQLLPDNAATAATVAMQFTLANDPSLTSAQVSVTFRCLVGDRNGDGVPDASDIPGVCDPKGDASWFVKSGLAVSPCVPANGDKCNVIYVAASNNVKFYLAPAIGKQSGSTGALTSAACNGPCGGPPTAPVDVMLIMDRTGSMSGTELANAQSAANALLSMYNPALQRVGLGLLGSSQTAPSAACASPNTRAYAKAAGSVPGYTTPTYVPNWIPVGLTGTGSPTAPVNEAYLNADGTLNTGSMLVQAIRCYSVSTSGTGTDLATPMKMATYYLNTYGRPGVRKGIILETDGQPNAGPSAGPNYCAQANTEASSAKTAGIEVFTIGFGLDGANDVNCPDTSGTFQNKKATYLLASMATQPTTDNLCVAAENTDGDHFFCQPKSSDLTSIFQVIAGQLAAGAHLISLPQ